MPKNPKNPTYPPIRPVPPITPRPPRPEDVDGRGGIAVDFAPTEPMLLELTHVSPTVLATVTAGDAVILQIDSLPIAVTTIHGLVLGQVALDDVARVRARRARQAVVVDVQANPAGCVVEVR